ncbi:RagB/SusD family nutrient uptake outer membrane protein [Dyadobacter fermentans]|uniref:RagB/SusD family nutrient uptake outer membrane protein n=1 Tax=Dyadobacter fermentans TaxID=94254 RepID=UPI001CC1BC00|nr:RagB/SusD family nutrient uptake outer membrane protein [Dyadobacter fermentans]MBZ1362503.1 RagB/SusD family nutrient uptake outer membrane protein [Dyadobacter fermentans]
MRNRTYQYLCAIMLASSLGLMSCEDVLDKKNLSAITEQDVWKDPALATAFVNNVYLSVPSWDVTLADATDEASRSNAWISGTTTIDNGGPSYWPYADIRKMNLFLQEIDKPTSTIDQATKTTLKGQVRFIRAFVYFEMIKRYGGVPLVTTAQERDDDLRVSRNSTKECFDFVLSELNTAAGELPESYPVADLGRVTKGAALAMKGRVLLFRASPQFNPTGNPAHWQAAYDANKEALTYLSSKGVGLIDTYSNAALFLAEMNKEVIFAIRYLNPAGRTQNRDAAVRPIDFTANATGGCHPTQELVDAFPLKSGKKTAWNDPQHAGDVTKSWQNRDNRFYATVVYNGVSYLGKTMELNADASGNGYSYGKQNGTLTGYYSRKAIDESLDITNSQISGTDYIDMRYAEVLMNYAEAAMELNKLPEAFDVLKQIRKRAGINETTPGDASLAGKFYGLSPAMTQAEMRQAIQDERYIEFAFEQKRLWDLRRWRLMHLKMTGKDKRHAMILNTDASKPGGFTYTLYDRDNAPMVYNENMYFLPLSTATIQGNANLKQTKGWGDGTFDPLEGM